MLLFLWENHIGSGNRKCHVAKHGVDAPLLAATKEIEHYRMQGWNIQAIISVGSTWKSTFAIANNPRMIVDDEHHPNCFRYDLAEDSAPFSYDAYSLSLSPDTSVRLTFNMIRPATDYSDIVACKEIPKLNDNWQPFIEPHSE